MYIWIPIMPPALIHLKCIGINFFFMIVLPVIQQLTTLKLVLMIYSVYYANCENWCNEKIRHENDNCIVAYTYLKTNKCQKNLLALYVYTRYVWFKKKWTTGFYSKYPATEGNLPVRVLKYKCQMQLKMHSDRSGSKNLEFRVSEVLWSCGFMASLHFFQQNKWA